jgi:hypothetical protein
MSRSGAKMLGKQIGVSKVEVQIAKIATMQ